MLPPIDEIERAFPFAIRAVRRLGGQGAREVFSIADEHVLASAASWASPETLTCELDLLEHLARHDFVHAPRLVRPRDGSWWVELAGRRWYATTFVPGSTPAPTPKTYASLGTTLARLHGLPPFDHATEFTIKNMFTRELPGRADGLAFQAEFAALVDAIAFRPDARRTPIHTDPSPANSIVTSDGVLVLVDWECAGSGEPLIDLGAPLITQLFSSDLSFAREAAIAFYTAYRDAGGQLPAADQIVAAGMMTALSYLRFGDVDANWRRVQAAWSRRDELALLIER